ncbi:MAG: crossover junction endodeoxyribonuclease RuvC [Patescibacteria group bacterium]
MIILGIDPGTNRIGYGLIDHNSQKTRVLDYGCVDLKSDRNNPLSHLPLIQKEIVALLKKYQPEVVAVEKLFFFKNKKTVIGVSQARGVIVSSALNQGCKVKEFTPLEVKQAVSGYGRADKKAVQKMVRLVLSLDRDPQPDDAADALAVAICCAHTVSWEASSVGYQSN